MEESIKTFVKSKVIEFLSGHKLETNKFELKQKWYDLSCRKCPGEESKTIYNREYYEFLKDISGIINSTGGDSGYIVIGINQKTRQVYDTRLENSGLDDSSKIKNIIISNIDRPFVIDIDYIEIEGKNLSVIHTPATLYKPHVILSYISPSNQEFENEIFVRNGSGSIVAGKSDLDRMYWERGNIILPEKLFLTINRLNSGFEPQNLSDLNNKGRITYHLSCSFTNDGTRPLTIYSIRFKLQLNQKLLVESNEVSEIWFNSNILASTTTNEDNIIIGMGV
jgi:hypothetical protein